MPTANEILRDLNIGHQVDLHQYANGLVRKIMATLNEADASLFSELIQALERLPADSFTVQRLDLQLKAVRAMNSALYDRALKKLDTDLRELTQHELGFQGQMLETVPPVSVPLVALAPETVYAAAMAEPFQGRLLSEWFATLSVDSSNRLRDTLRIGFINNESISQMVAKLRGTRARGYSDGVTEISRRNLESVVRTATAHTASVARDRLFAANGDLIKGVVWLSTLDNRTSEICRVRDLKQYTNTTHQPIGHNLPWLGGPGNAHWGCRSCSTPILKSWKEMGIDMAEMPESTRSSMSGQVPSDLNYSQWLLKQSAARQDDILGPTRGLMLRSGKATVDSFTNDKGKWLTLSELKK